MKKVIYLIPLVLVLALHSCIPTTYTTSTVDPLQPKFVSIEKVLDLKLNSSYENVVSTLGQKPYNVLSAQSGEYTIYSYYYKFVERELSIKRANQIGGETEGEQLYRNNMQMLYLFFKDNKLEAYITTQGMAEGSTFIMIKNTLYKVSKENDEFIILLATKMEEAENSSAAPTKNTGIIGSFLD